MALSEEEKQKIIEEERLRAKVRKETKGIGCATGIIILIMLVLLGIIVQHQRSTQDIKNPEQKFARSIKALNKHTSQKNCEIIDIWIGGIMPSMKGPVYSILVDKNIIKEKLRNILLRLFNEKKEERGSYMAVYITAFISKEDYEDGHCAGSLNWSQGDDKPRIKFNENYWEYGKDYWQGIEEREKLKKLDISLAQQIKLYFEKNYKVPGVILAGVILDDIDTVTVKVDLDVERLLKFKGKDDPENCFLLSVITDNCVCEIGYRCLHTFSEINQVNIDINLDGEKAYSIEMPRSIAYSVDINRSPFRDKSYKNINSFIGAALNEYIINKFAVKIYNDNLKQALLLTEENVRYSLKRCTIGNVIKINIDGHNLKIIFREYDYEDWESTLSGAKQSIAQMSYVLFKEFSSLKYLEIICLKPKLSVAVDRLKAKKVKGANSTLSVTKGWEKEYDFLAENKNRL